MIGAMKRFLVYLLLLVAAVVCFFVGFGESIVPLMVAYVVLEIILGARLGTAFRRRQRHF